MYAVGGVYQQEFGGDSDGQRVGVTDGKTMKGYLAEKVLANNDSLKKFLTNAYAGGWFVWIRVWCLLFFQYQSVRENIDLCFTFLCNSPDIWPFCQNPGAQPAALEEPEILGARLSHGVQLFGLRNMGNTRFMAASLTSLALNEVFRQQIFAIMAAIPDNWEGIALLRSFHELMLSLGEGKGLNANAEAFSAIVDIVRSRDPQFRIGKQDDAAIFSNSFLDLLNTELRAIPLEIGQNMITNATDERTRAILERSGFGRPNSEQSSTKTIDFRSPFTIDIQTTMRSVDSASSKNSFVPPVPALTLGLPTTSPGDQSLTVQGLLERHFNEELITGVQFDDRDTPCDAVRTSQLKYVPPVLTVHLTRIQLDRYSRRKFTGNIEVPKTLDLTPYVQENNGDLPPYELSSFPVHIGNARSGHYVSYIKCNGVWFCFDDSKVKIVTEERAMRVASKGGTALSYTLRRPFPPLAPESLQTSSGDSVYSEDSLSDAPAEVESAPPPDPGSSAPVSTSPPDPDSVPPPDLRSAPPPNSDPAPPETDEPAAPIAQRAPAAMGASLPAEVPIFGVYNGTNSCYRNAVMNSLAWNEAFFQWISVLDGITHDIPKLEILHQLYRVMKSMREGGSVKENSAAFRELMVLLQRRGLPVQIGQQDDATVFFEAVLDALREEFKAITPEEGQALLGKELDDATREMLARIGFGTRNINLIFDIHLQNAIYSLGSEHTEMASDTISTSLTVGLPNRPIAKFLKSSNGSNEPPLTLPNLLEGTFKKETVDDPDDAYEFADGIRRAFTRQPLLRSSPVELTIKLQRTPSDASGRIQKDGRDVEIPEVVDIGRFVSGNDGSPILYGLVGFIVQTGSTTGGHYVAYSKINGVWHFFNDSSVSTISEQRAMVAARQAYTTTYTPLDQPAAP
ncbi:MAG: ubiquitin carboxyl-terminal hydrolase [Puniceicoccales bacterium]|jgi:ubiquitin C-terminal hydrolase|nr:ubiquitin carboxyl-terminal hydrolase [Puniceicoccales bacterium]